MRDHALGSAAIVAEAVTTAARAMTSASRRDDARRPLRMGENTFYALWDPPPRRTGIDGQPPNEKIEPKF
ncbi:hypothetical protein [Methylobacterium tarhaniae]|uniref:hypothetical protein n=1 Tax=Methylobacterium tarhaniae TaxID=1187852 RepID=UPI003D0069F2